MSATHWLNGVPLGNSSTVFFIGDRDAELRTELARQHWHGRVIVLAPPSFAGLEQLTPAITVDAAQPVVVLQPEMMRDHRQAVKDAARRIAAAWFGAKANEEARRQNAGPYLLNTLRNLNAIDREGNAASLANLFPSVPAIVVAAGPSLDGNIADIARCRGRAIIVAVDTALRPLLAAGIQPDLVVAVDPSESNANHLVDLPPCDSTFLVAEGSLDPEALAHFHGRTFFFNVADHHPWPWLRSVGIERARLRAWGSVLTTAFDLALMMGCSPVVFAGADLAFTGGRPYARHTSYDEVWTREQAWGRQVEDIFADRIRHWPMAVERGVDGAEVRTAPHLKSFRDWIVTEAGAAKDRRVVNATPGGILAGSSIQLATFKDALEGQPNTDGSLLIRSAHARSVRVRSPLGAGAGVAAPTKAEWSAFASVPIEAIAAALAPPAAAPVVAVAVEPVTTQPAVDPDAEFLETLKSQQELLAVVVGDDLRAIDDLPGIASRLEPSQALVVEDRAGASQGTAVRRALDQLLCERQDLSLEYRRFAHPASRVSVLRRIKEWQLPEQCDAVKRDPAHQPIATKLAPVIVEVLNPKSVIDIGCGAGYWPAAFREAGVADAAGITGDVLDPSLIDRRFDVALCLEVIQRMPTIDHDALVAQCARASDQVVFSSQVPGVPGSIPFERPLQHWAEKFWRHGYVVDDVLRPELERRADHAETVYDMLVVFRRLFSPTQVADARLRRWAIAQAARLHELYLQKVWWATSAASAPRSLPAKPSSKRVAWPIPSSRMAATADGRRVFRFRTDAARWFVSHDGVDTTVRENGCVLTAASRWRDEVSFTSTDGSDPRTNRRHYSIDLPTHIAWAESQAWADISNHGL